MKRFLSYFKKRSYGLNELDLKLRPYIRKQNGFFIEVGANDGISQSNTLYFEKYMGWNGLLIEAIPELAEKCRKNRPKCIVENCALVRAGYPEATVEMNYCNLMSIVKGALKSPEEELKHLESGRPHLDIGDKTYTVNVQARMLSDLLDKHQVTNVDLFSLDVEGYEVEVLKGINFSRHHIEFILVEVHNRDEIESAICHLYKPLAILNIENSYSDILYRLKR